MSRLCCRPRSPAVKTPLEDDDLLGEILLRLPPQPSSLPRASLVCKGWHSLVSDPGFFRRFRRHHRRNPPLLGFFDRDDDLSFIPTLEAPNRVPPGRFSFPRGEGDRFLSLGCRRGLVLIFDITPNQMLVWDPVTGDQHRLGIPPGFATHAEKTLINGAVLRAAGDTQFQVVLAVGGNDDKQHERVLACVYSSATSSWGDLISTRLPSEVPVHMLEEGDYLFWIMRAEGGSLGLLFQAGPSFQLWKRKIDCDGVDSWVPGRTIELDKLLSLNLRSVIILGFAETNNVVFFWTCGNPFMVHLESLQFKKLFETRVLPHYHPFESVYTAETDIGAGHDGADLFHNA